MKKCIFVGLMIFLFSCSDGQRIEKTINKYKSRYPIMITTDLRIDSVLYNKHTNAIGYHYSILSDSLSSHIMTTDLDKIKEDITQEIKHSVEMRFFRSKNVIFNYIYVEGNSKTVIAEFSIPPSEYK